MNVLLVIAQDLAIRESLRAALPETNLLLFESTVDKALRRLVSIKADAVVVDDGPHLGQQALAQILEAAPALPAIVLSSRSDPESLASLTLAGARACVAKPFSCEAICEAVESVTGRGEAPLEQRVADPNELTRDTALSRHQTALRWLSRIARSFEELDRLSRNLAEALTDIFDAVRSAVLLEVNGTVRVVAGNGIPGNVADALRLDFASGLMRWFEEKACLFDRAANRDAGGAVKEMLVLGARLAVPLLRDGRVCGALVLGEKASGLEYTFEERELLTIIGRCASTTLEKACRHHEAWSEQSRLDAVLSNVSAGVVAVAPDKTVTMMNPQAERLLQLRATDVIGRSVQKLGSAFADVVLRTLADGEPRFRQQVREPATDATLELTVIQVGTEGVVATFFDVPEEQVSREEVAYSPFWGYLAERVAQEIKNPMVAINTFAQLLPRKYDSPDFREAFERVVQKEVARINAVVEILFEFAQQPDLVLKRADVNETLRGVLRAFEEELEARSITLEAEWAHESTEAEIDLIHFPRAVRNVLQNSIDAMPSGGTLKVKTCKLGDTCQVLIADTGPSIPEDSASDVFMPFFSTKARGMGLGLATAARIMHHHKGELKLVATPEGGSAFEFSIPSARTDYENDPRS